MEQVSVDVDDIVSRVSATDDQALLSAPVLNRIVACVLEAVRAERAHDERLRTEQLPLGSARPHGHGR
jgi:hypothetical protein